VKRLVALYIIFSVLVLFLVAPLAAKDWYIFDDEVLHGSLSNHDGTFVVSKDNPYAGEKCLARELASGDWAWITGIGESDPMNLDLTGIVFEDAFIEFYADSGTVAIGYMELRLAGVSWMPADAQAIVQTDGVEGYEQILVPFTEFTVKGLERAAEDLDEFTGGTNKVDIWSVGFSPGGNTTLYVDEVRIADLEGTEIRSVKPEGKLATTWAVVKSSR